MLPIWGYHPKYRGLLMEASSFQISYNIYGNWWSCFLIPESILYLKKWQNMQYSVGNLRLLWSMFFNSHSLMCEDHCYMITKKQFFLDHKIQVVCRFRTIFQTKFKKTCIFEFTMLFFIKLVSRTSYISYSKKPQKNKHILWL